jgi:hypothetical protein
VAENLTDFNGAEESLNRQYDYFKNNFRYRFEEHWSALNKSDEPDWDIDQSIILIKG